MKDQISRPDVSIGQHYEKIGKSAAESRLCKNRDGEEVSDQSRGGCQHHRVVEDNFKCFVKRLIVDITFIAVCIVSCFTEVLKYKI